MATEDPLPADREAQIQRLLGAYETHLRKTLPTGPQTLEQIERTAQDIGEEGAFQNYAKSVTKQAKAGRVVE